jgi:hypothetical protein
MTEPFDLKEKVRNISVHSLGEHATTCIAHFISRLALLRIVARVGPLRLIAPSQARNEVHSEGRPTEDSRIMYSEMGRGQRMLRGNVLDVSYEPDPAIAIKTQA